MLGPQAVHRKPFVSDSSERLGVSLLQIQSLGHPSFYKVREPPLTRDSDRQGFTFQDEDPLESDERLCPIILYDSSFSFRAGFMAM